MRRYIFVLMSLAFLCFLPEPGFAQKCRYDKEGAREVPCAFSVVEIRGGTVREISGKVLDSNNAIMDDATVVVFKLAGKEEVYIGTQKTDQKGRYCFGKLPAGNYVLKAGVKGFMCAKIPLRLEPDDVKVLNRKLKDINLHPGV